MTPNGIRVVIFLLLAGTSRLALGAVEEYEGVSVSRIRFDPLQQPLPQDDLWKLVPMRPGEPLRIFDVRTAIERLHATGRYTQVTVHAEREDGGVAIRIETQGTWFIGRITVEGVPEPPNRGQLVNATKLTLGTEFHDDDLRAAKENLEAKLEANGFFESKAEAKLTYDAPTEQVFIDFQIQAGPRARFTDPVIGGVPADRARQIVRATNWERFWGLAGWKPVTESRVSRGLDRIRRSFAKQDFLQSKVTLDNLEYVPSLHRARPELTIDIGPKIAVRTEGAKVPRGRMRQLIPIYQEQSADRDLIIEGMRNLTSYFRGQGYFEAKAEFSTETEPGGTRAVIYSIDRGERFKLASMKVDGNRYFSTATLRERMATTPATRIRYRRGRFSDSLVRADIDSLRELYVSNGFRAAKFDFTVDRARKGKSNWLYLKISVEEGVQTLVSKQTITGVSAPHLAAVRELLTSEPGQPYSEANLAADRDAVLSYYYNNGYPNAAFDWQVSPSAKDPDRMEVRFSVQEGSQQFVRDFLIGGLETSDPDMVYRRIRLNPGEPLSQSKMVESQRRLYDLGVFARVDVAVQNPEGQEPGKYLLYQFEEARRYSLNLGFGAEIARIGSGSPNFDAPAGTPGFSPRASIGISRSNFAGTGHTLALQTRVSNIQQRALLTYLAPQFKGSDNVTLTISGLYDLSRDIRTFQAKRQEGSVQLSYRARKDVTVQGRFSYRRNTISSLLIDDNLIPIFTRPGRVGIFSTTLIQDRRDNPIDSRRGYYNSVDFGFASRAFASQTDHTRILARNSSYHRVVNDVVFARSIAIGWLNGLNAGGASAIPLPERFYSGGASSHRGFPENQAGPRDLRTGFPLGGSGLLTNNLELRFPLIGDTVGGVLFHDAGNVYSSLGNMSLRWRQRGPADFDYMVHAFGFGLRYRTPVGPVRIDLGYSANSPRFDFDKRDGFVPVVPRTIVQQRISQFQFHFSLGQTF